MGMENGMFWSEIGSGFGELGSTPPPQILRSTPSPKAFHHVLCDKILQDFGAFLVALPRSFFAHHFECGVKSLGRRNEIYVVVNILFSHFEHMNLIKCHALPGEQQL